MKKLLLLSIVGISLSAAAKEPGPVVKSIYGDDNRIDALDYHDAKFVERAKSVAGQVHYKALQEDPRNPGMFEYDKYILQEEQSLCPNQPFEEQYMLMGCSGFLVGEDTLVTASHCVQDEFDCENFRWVFDFYEGTELIPDENIYKCKQIIASKDENSTRKYKDYAVIKLDRKVIDRKPLEFRKKGKVLPGTKLVIIGHPTGLPMKIADDAKVAMLTKEDLPKPKDQTIDSLSMFDQFIRSITHWNYVFRSNLDSFQGNSGGPVFNKKTGVVEGILVEGGEDYEMVDLNGDGSKFCRRVVKYKDRLWNAQELVFRITKVKEIQ